jgi:hypothetical protein
MLQNDTKRNTKESRFFGAEQTLVVFGGHWREPIAARTFGNAAKRGRDGCGGDV